MKTIGSKTQIKIKAHPLSGSIGKQSMGLVLLSVLVLSSAIGVVYVKYLNRKLHTELQQIQDEQNKLHVEWTQLLLEEGTLGSDVRVDKIAREELGMIIPPSNEIVVIKP